MGTMRILPVEVAGALVVCLSFSSTVDAQARKKQAPVRTPRSGAASKRVPQLILPCGDLLGFQVLLDRQGFSPGEIDGKPGDNFLHALAAFQTSRTLAAGAPRWPPARRRRPSSPTR
jgi:peptidoglycan hydrolase-like protein with peptidoglycan-binding domain